MNARHFFSRLCLSALSLAAASPAFGLANRVFVSARSGNDANTCDNILAPCQTFAGAVTKLNPGGEAIVLDSGGYGAVTITQSLTLEAPAGVLAFIHPSSGDAITINAGVSDTVILRGLVLNSGSGNGIAANTVGTLTIENCAISGFASDGVRMAAVGTLNMKNTDVEACANGVEIANSSGAARASIDHCHFDHNAVGFRAGTTSPGGSTTTVTNSTANNNSSSGWLAGGGGSGLDVVVLESCSGSGNTVDGLAGSSTNASSLARYSSCVFSNNGNVGVQQSGNGLVQSRGNNTITANVLGPTFGIVGSFAPL